MTSLEKTQGSAVPAAASANTATTATASTNTNLLATSDYVLSVKYGGDKDASENEQLNFTKLIKHLRSNGLYSQARPAEGGKVLLFVKADYSVLYKHLKSEILKDYVYGLKSSIDDDNIPENLTKSERLRLVYAILTNPIHEGGAGITPGSGDWEFVEKIVPLYNYDVTTNILKQWLKKPLIDETDILKIKDIAGEKVALYFGFVRFYFLWLAIPAALGLISHLFFKRFSAVYTILNSLWAIVFINAWKKKQAIYATAWDTTGSSKVEITRAEYVSETIQSEPSSALESPSFRRNLKEYSFIPVAIFGGALLLSYQFFCFFIEIFLGEFYQGPGKSLLAFVPTILIVLGAPQITAFYSKFISKAVDWENHETQSSYSRSFNQKLFVHNFLSSYAPLLITIFFYFPFGHKANFYLKQIQTASSRFGVPVIQERYSINTNRLVGQFSFFALTGLVVGFLTENVLPHAIRFAKEKFSKPSELSKLDSPEEAEFLRVVRKQVELPEFDVEAEYRELVINFGYIAIFSPIWSLAPLFSLISAYVEIKGDLDKLLAGSSRPIPVRVENSEPWGTDLKFLTWVGTIVSPIITTFFRSNDRYLSSSSYTHLSSAIGANAWEAVTAGLISENISIFLNFAVEAIFNSLTTQVERLTQQKDLKLRRSYVEAYARDSVQKRSIGTDSSQQLWADYADDSAIKQAAAIVHRKAQLEAHLEKEKIEKEKREKLESIANSNEKSGYKQFADDDSNLHSRAGDNSTTASKTVPATAKLSATAAAAAATTAAVATTAAAAAVGTTTGVASAVTSAAKEKVGALTGSTKPEDIRSADGVPTTATGTAPSITTSSDPVTNSRNTESVETASATSASASSVPPTSDSSKSKNLTAAGIATGVASSIGLKNKSRPNSAYYGNEGEQTNNTDVNTSPSKDKFKKKIFGFVSSKKDKDSSSSSASKKDKETSSTTSKKDDSSSYAGTTNDLNNASSRSADPVEKKEIPSGSSATNTAAATSASAGASTGAATAPSTSATNASTGITGAATGAAAAAVGTGAGVAAGLIGAGATIGTAVGLGSSAGKSEKAAESQAQSQSQSQSQSDYESKSTSNAYSKSKDTSETDSATADKSTAGTTTSDSTAATPENSDSSNSTAPKEGNSTILGGVTSGLAGAGAAIGSAVGISATTEQRASSSSISNNSLDGATLPPDFRNKKPSGSLSRSASPQLPHNTASTAAAGTFGTASAVSTSGKPQDKRTLDPVALDKETGKQVPGSENATTTADNGNGNGSQNVKAAFGAGGLAAVAAGLGQKVTGSNQTSEVDKYATNGQSSFAEQAKGSIGKAGSTLNDYVQLAADKADDYAATSNNAYVKQGNSYLQKVADKSDEYAQQQAQQQTQSQSQSQSQPQSNSQSQSYAQPQSKAQAGVESSTGSTKPNSLDVNGASANDTTAAATATAATAAASDAATPSTPTNSNLHTTGSTSARHVGDQVLENRNPFNGATGGVTASGEVAEVSQLGVPTKTVDGDSSSSHSSSRKKGSFLKTVKNIVKSNHNTPKKTSSH